MTDPDKNPLKPLPGVLPHHTHRHWVPFTISCGQCVDTGAVLAREIGEIGSPFIFRCDCLRGINSARAYPEWRYADKNRFERIVERR